METYEEIQKNMDAELQRQLLYHNKVEEQIFKTGIEKDDTVVFKLVHGFTVEFKNVLLGLDGEESERVARANYHRWGSIYGEMTDYYSTTGEGWKYKAHKASK